jgi:hypothetical protein
MVRERIGTTVGNYLAALLLAAAAGPSMAQQGPKAADFYYCAQFYRWFDAQIKTDNPLKEQVASLAHRFELNGDILSMGTRSQPLQRSLIERVSADVKVERESQKTYGDILKDGDIKCRSTERVHAAALKTKGAEFLEVQRPLFTHALPGNQVAPELIAGRLEFLRHQEGVSVDDKADVVTYTFFQQVGESSQTVHHIFTKEGHPAHPSVIFLSVLKQGGASAGSTQSRGSYAGSRSEFEKLFRVLVLFNR